MGKKEVICRDGYYLCKEELKRIGKEKNKEESLEGLADYIFQTLT